MVGTVALMGCECAAPAVGDGSGHPPGNGAADGGHEHDGHDGHTCPANGHDHVDEGDSLALYERAGATPPVAANHEEIVAVAPPAPCDAACGEDDEDDEDDDGDGSGFDAALAAAPLQVECFRPQPRVLWRGRELSQAGSPQTWELLALLMSLPRGPITKEMVIDALWPEDAAGADNRLQQVIYRAHTVLSRQAPELPRGFLRVGRDRAVRIDPELVASDVWRVQDLCQFAGDRRRPRPPLDEALRALHRAMDLAGVAEEPEGYGRPLLGGGAYDWLDRAGGGRSLPMLYAGLLRRTIEAVAARALDEGCPEAAAQLYEIIFDREPGEQGIARQLFKCYRALGDRHGLARVDRQLRAELKRVYLTDLPEAERAAIAPEGYAPSPDTVKVFEQSEAALSPDDRRSDRRPRRAVPEANGQASHFARVG